MLTTFKERTGINDRENESMSNDYNRYFKETVIQKLFRQFQHRAVERHLEPDSINLLSGFGSDEVQKMMMPNHLYAETAAPKTLCQNGPAANWPLENVLSMSATVFVPNVGFNGNSKISLLNRSRSNSFTSSSNRKYISPFSAPDKRYASTNLGKFFICISVNFSKIKRLSSDEQISSRIFSNLDTFRIGKPKYSTDSTIS
uniref:Uncharacterized protein n=1 Tax=Romanomermis culicivorax TaxID=13658 RepID=A0A915IGJ4_ROMCU